MQYTKRFAELNSQFKIGKDIQITESKIFIRFFDFKSLSLFSNEIKIPGVKTDEQIDENISFQYPVFIPHSYSKFDKAILLLHGLNERNWSKYLTWAEFLCEKTGKPVILFPIAFHMNRSPESWSNPRDLRNILDIRRQLNGEDRSLSFANAALSQRISESPFRFFNAGRQSVADLTLLVSEMKLGKHELFLPDTKVDIFAYSIGAFLSQIMVMANPKEHFSDTRLFLFCGGGIFSSMCGESRYIMDKLAFNKLYAYYMHDFLEDVDQTVGNKLLESFKRMISPDNDKVVRESFFKNTAKQFKGVSLLNDKVMPYQGILDAMGTKCANEKIQLMDFPFDYYHENPFPIDAKHNPIEVDFYFNSVFNNAAEFLS